MADDPFKVVPFPFPVHGSRRDLGAPRRDFLYKIVSGLAELSQLLFREDVSVGALVYEGALLTTDFSERRVEKSPDDAVTADGTQEVAREIPEDVLHPIHGMEIGAQARLAKVAGAHGELDGVTFHEASVVEFSCWLLSDGRPRVDDLSDVALRCFTDIHGSRGCYSTATPPSVDVGLNHGGFFVDALGELDADVLFRNTPCFERQDATTLQEPGEEGDG